MTRRSETHRDVLVGLFILAAAGLLLGLMLGGRTTVVGDRSLFLRTTNAEGITTDTRVFLQGLEVGRVERINPVVDASGLSFVAEIGISATLPDGTPLDVPVGTRGIIEEPSPLTAAVVRLEMPPGGATGGSFYQPGDTIPSERRASAVDLVSDLATELKDEVLLTLQQTRALMEQSARTIARTQSVLATTNQTIGTTTPKIDEALNLLAANLEQTQLVLDEIRPRVGPLQDSLAATLGDARAILTMFDTLATTAQDMLVQNRAAVQEAVDHLMHTTVVLENFAAQVSRRPTRLLTGVRPPVLDTTPESR